MVILLSAGNIESRAGASAQASGIIW